MPAGGRQAAVSALTGQGCETLLSEIDSVLGENYRTITLQIAASDGKLLSWLHKNAEILSSDLQDERVNIVARLTAADNNRLQKILAENAS